MTVDTAPLPEHREPEVRPLMVPPASRRTPRVVPQAAPEPRLDGEDRLRLIAEAAYFRAEQRDFAPGQELDDWLAAEIEVDALLNGDDRA